MRRFLISALVLGTILSSFPPPAAALPRPSKTIPIICSGPGCLRLITLLGAQDQVVGVDTMESRRHHFDARPYALATPRFKTLPIFGEFRGRDLPEKILGLSPRPKLIFKTHPQSGMAPDILEQKTRIPVVVMGSTFMGPNDFFQGLIRGGKCLDREERARALIDFFQGQVAELARRTQGLDAPPCFVGGIAMSGAHGFLSTEPCYPPLTLVNGHNIARTRGTCPGQGIFSKEAILKADPPILFVDLATLKLGQRANGVEQLKRDPVLCHLSAVKAGRVYGLLPYNWYAQNQGSLLANAWFMGSILHPGAFKDIDPAQTADEIYEFLFGQSLFEKMNAAFEHRAFRALDMGGHP